MTAACTARSVRTAATVLAMHPRALATRHTAAGGIAWGDPSVRTGESLTDLGFVAVETTVSIVNSKEDL